MTQNIDLSSVTQKHQFPVVITVNKSVGNISCCEVVRLKEIGKIIAFTGLAGLAPFALGYFVSEASIAGAAVDIRLFCQPFSKYPK